jgi:hypothetical protein
MLGNGLSQRVDHSQGDERDDFVGQYFACTRGELSTADLWQWCGLDPAGLDQEYVDFFVTTPGIVEFVSGMHVEGDRIACLTNDAAAWSRALRRQHQLDVLGVCAGPHQKEGHPDHRLVPPSEQVLERGRPFDRRVSARRLARTLPCSGGSSRHRPAKRAHVSLTDASAKWFRPMSVVHYRRRQGLGSARSAQPRL